MKVESLHISEINLSYLYLHFIIFKVNRVNSLVMCAKLYDAGLVYSVLTRSFERIKRIYHGLIVRIEKAKPEGRPFRFGPSFSKVKNNGLPEGSTYPILTNYRVIDYFSCLSP